MPTLGREFTSPITVHLADRSYDIHVGADILSAAGGAIAEAAGRRGFVITHPNIARLHGEALARGLAGLDVQTILVPVGERQKSLRRAARLWDALVAAGADRRSVIVAFGGGVIGDLAGFVAATYMRGIPLVQVPTTLVAQVDSSVGGKVAINHPRAKNLIGAFHQPRLVIADVSLLGTLRPRDYREGLAEVVKTAAIADEGLFGWLESNLDHVARRDPAAMARVVRRCCEIKAAVVEEDERETGSRAILNFGHTVGHAVEAVTGYGRLRHGEAIAIGMAAAARLATSLGLLDGEQERRVVRLLERCRLPVRIPGLPAAELIAALPADKKAVGGTPRFVLPRGIGRVEHGLEAPPEVVGNVLRQLGAVG